MSRGVNEAAILSEQSNETKPKFRENLMPLHIAIHVGGSAKVNDEKSPHVSPELLQGMAGVSTTMKLSPSF
ncbi:hypothetical protein TDB9533_02261 [Thalassocella blandensis]|nr:hypothetical protein TDB9533_02261 [Thalassocella blandensis]